MDLWNWQCKSKRHDRCLMKVEWYYRPRVLGQKNPLWFLQLCSCYNTLCCCSAMMFTCCQIKYRCVKVEQILYGLLYYFVLLLTRTLKTEEMFRLSVIWKHEKPHINLAQQRKCWVSGWLWDFSNVVVKDWIAVYEHNWDSVDCGLCWGIKLFRQYSEGSKGFLLELGWLYENLIVWWSIVPVKTIIWCVDNVILLVHHWKQWCSM